MLWLLFIVHFVCLRSWPLTLVIYVMVECLYHMCAQKSSEPKYVNTKKGKKLTVQQCLVQMRLLIMSHQNEPPHL